MAQRIEAIEIIPQRQHRRRNQILLLVLLFAVTIVTALGIIYWLNRDQGTEAFPAPAGATVPRFVFAIDSISEPVAVAATPLGDRIFVAEGSGDKLIRVFDRNGDDLTAISLPALPLEDRAPAAMAIGPDDHLYVVDSMQHEVLIYSLDGEYISTFLPNNDPDFDWFPVSITLDKVGNLYIADQTQNHHRVMIFDPNGNLIKKFGISGSGAGMFLFPTDVLVDSSGRIFVADSANSRIQVFDSDGQYLEAIHGTDLSLPTSLIMDNDGRLHVLDSLGHSVAGIRLSNPPTVEFRYGTLGREYGQLYFPADLTRDETGRLYIADRFNNRVDIFTFGSR